MQLAIARGELLLLEEQAVVHERQGVEDIKDDEILKKIIVFMIRSVKNGPANIARFVGLREIIEVFDMPRYCSLFASKESKKLGLRGPTSEEL